MEQCNSNTERELGVQMGVQRYYAPREVARILGFHYESVRKMVHRGELHAVKFGRRLRIPGSELKRWIAENASPVQVERR